MIKKTFFFVLIVLTIVSCERAFMADDIPATAPSTFDYLWQRFDQQYSMFDVKNVNWQAVYDSLRPRLCNHAGHTG